MPQHFRIVHLIKFLHSFAFHFSKFNDLIGLKNNGIRSPKICIENSTNEHGKYVYIVHIVFFKYDLFEAYNDDQ